MLSTSGQQRLGIQGSSASKSSSATVDTYDETGKRVEETPKNAADVRSELSLLLSFVMLAAPIASPVGKRNRGRVRQYNSRNRHCQHLKCSRLVSRSRNEIHLLRRFNAAAGGRDSN